MLMTKLTLKAPLSSETQEKLSNLVNSKSHKPLDKEPQHPTEDPSTVLKPSSSSKKTRRTHEEASAAQKVDQEKARENFEATKAWLETTFPKAFDFKDPKPLKIGIQKDFNLETPFSRAQRSKVIRSYVNSPSYLTALVNGQWRYNLNGEPVEEISQKHKDYAAKALAKKKSESQN
jgi:ProP effector